ncbi:hypothetical protein K469DRAFT_716842 [Zopfia rhizophila CBS 207.26]|uniref:Rrn9 domain-containing protein n=1 Tax=Zopfia rhizophila CBS 207.26 TaxID=1314779 RepID=A0A6A6EMY0_9PEZI|nr:hypothetical protein K469DRAFT_716842 [Zopfia rhizophila CBS 207.26]
MSLFGGDAIYDSADSSSRNSTSDESELSSSSRRAHTARLFPPNIQAAGDVRHIPSVDGTIAADVDDFDKEDEEYEPSIDEASRPNRYTGKAQTWRGYTAADRQLAASLVQIEAGDLAAHLYNAHALKRRVRLPEGQLNKVKNWQSKDFWLKKGDDLKFENPFGGIEQELVPHKIWTAWPLRPEKVPAPSERFGRRRSAEEGDGWKIGGLGEKEVGDELREEILALFLRQAKEKWNGMEWEDEAQDQTGDRSRSEARSMSKTVQREQLRVRSRSRSQGFDSAQSDIGMLDDGGFTPGYDSGTKGGKERKLKFYSSKIRIQGRPPPPSVEPVILADDDRARRILQPTINSLLTHLDGLAMTVCQTRLNHFGRDHSDTSDSEAVSDAESVLSQLRSSSRTRSRSSKTPATRASSRAPSIQKPTDSRTLRKRHSTQHQSKIPSDSDSASDYGAEHGEESEIQTESTEGSTPSRVRGTSKQRREQAGLLDWSEVLGIASMTGWNERAVARTAQRCATLFGEGMSFRTCDEGLAMKAPAEPVHYTPDMIPDLSATMGGTPKRPLFEKGMVHCPHTDCWGHDKEFKLPYRVIEHVKRIHGYDPRTNDSDNEERKCGGVHIDGFLQPISAKQGWLGKGRSKSAGERPKRKRR